MFCLKWRCAWCRVKTTLFTESRNWHKDVLRQLESRIAGRTFVHFEYVYHKLFDPRARDYYDVRNPVVKILLPKMQYEPSERLEVIRQAYTGLYQLVSAALFLKWAHSHFSGHATKRER